MRAVIALGNQNFCGTLELASIMCEDSGQPMKIFSRYRLSHKGGGMSECLGGWVSHPVGHPLDVVISVMKQKQHQSMIIKMEQSHAQVNEPNLSELLSLSPATLKHWMAQRKVQCSDKHCDWSLLINLAIGRQAP